MGWRTYLELLICLTLQIYAEDSPFTTEITEECPVGTYVNGVSEYLDHFRYAGFNSDRTGVRYQLLGNDRISQLFTLDPTLGKLRVAARIDRESICPPEDLSQTLEKTTNLFEKDPFGIHKDVPDECVQPLNVLSTSSGASSRTSSGNLTLTQRILIYIIIRDINDNSPYWITEQSYLRTSFVETPTHPYGLNALTSDGHSRTRVMGDSAIKFAKTIDHATDPDLGMNGTISYRLIGPGSEFFRLEDSGSIESSSSPYGLTQSFVRSGERLQESLSRSQLRIWPIVPLDRETEQFASGGVFNLTIIATDFGTPSKTGSVALLIDIIDVNDHPPVFVSDTYHTRLMNANGLDETQIVYRPVNGNIRENLPIGSQVLQLNATDKDSGLHARIRYEFCPCERSASAQSYFRIEPDTGRLVVAKRLDYDRGPRQFKFKVIAKDGAPEPYTLTGTAMVEIELTDDNDEAPEINVMLVDPIDGEDPGRGIADSTARYAGFPTSGAKFLGQYTAAISENPKMETVIAYIQVFDQDNHGQDQVNCHLGPSDNFTLRLDNIENGPLIFEKSRASKLDYRLIAGVGQSAEHILDRELTPIQHITLTCTDSGGNSAYVLILVRLRDINDNAPEFTSGGHFVFPILENQDLIGGKPIWLGRIQATDRDDGVNAIIEYRLDNNDSWYLSNRHHFVGSMETAFELDTQTGDLFARVPFDREAAPTDGIYRLKVSAVDKGSPRLTGIANVDVCIIDVNDLAPEFSKDVYTFSVAEDTRIQNVIGQVEAVDRDADSQGKIVYKLIGSGEKKSPRSQVRVKRNPELSEEPTMQKIVGPDTLIDTTTMETHNESSVTEKRSTWQSGSESRYDQYLSETDYFSVDRLTGKIRLKRRLDRETNAYFSLKVIATDVAPFSTVPARYRTYPRTIMNQTFPEFVTQRVLSSTATVVIAVMDVNDNAPVFRRPNSSVAIQLRQHETLGRQLLVVEASDDDEGDNARVTYSIRSEIPRSHGGPGKGYFSIDETSGILFLAKTLNTTMSHRLVIEACDNAVSGKKLCTLSPAIRISVFDGTEASDLSDTHSYPGRSTQLGQTDLLPLDLDTLSARSAVAVQASRRNEFVVVCLVVIFSLLLLATLFLVACLIHRRGTVRFWFAGGSRSVDGDGSARKTSKSSNLRKQQSDLWLDEAFQHESAKSMMNSKMDITQGGQYAVPGNPTDARYLVQENGMVYASPPIYVPNGMKFQHNLESSTIMDRGSHFSPARQFAYRGQHVAQIPPENFENERFQRGTETDFCELLSRSSYKPVASDYQSLDTVWNPFPDCSDMASHIKLPIVHQNRMLPGKPRAEELIPEDLNAQLYYEITDSEDVCAEEQKGLIATRKRANNRSATLGRRTNTRGKHRILETEDNMHHIKAGDLAVHSFPANNEKIGNDDKQRPSYTYQAYREGSFV